MWHAPLARCTRLTHTRARCTHHRTRLRRNLRGQRRHKRRHRKHTLHPQPFSVCELSATSGPCGAGVAVLEPARRWGGVNERGAWQRRSAGRGDRGEAPRLPTSVLLLARPRITLMNSTIHTLEYSNGITIIHRLRPGLRNSVPFLFGYAGHFCIFSLAPPTSHSNTTTRSTCSTVGPTRDSCAAVVY